MIPNISMKDLEEERRREVKLEKEKYGI